MKRALAAIAWTLCACLGLSACSVDEHKNPQRMSCADCKRKGGKCITQDYCLLSPGTQPDAAVADAGAPPEACSSEGQTELCYGAEDKSTAQQPPCRAGNRTCHNGFWGDCEKQVLPMAEICDGTDNDCDGTVDEDLDNAQCDVPDKEGLCQKGVQLCLAGALKCVQVTFPQTDDCNGKDDDCDGHTDEGTALRCYPAADGCTPSSTREGSYDCSGRCETGTRSCVDGKYSDTCEGSVVPDSVERCTDVGAAAIDEDCDGKTDESCNCKAGVVCYTGSPSDTQVHAPCHTGTQTCTDATHGSCTNEVTPKPEDCGNEGVDDDCDGVVDNVPLLDAACPDASKAQGACKQSARWQCQDGKQICVDASPGTEVCDGQGQDEDCDGKVDEGFDLQTDELNCGKCNAACSPGLTCCAGTCVDTNSSKAHCGKCGGACSSAQTCCSGGCATTSTDASNCGACGTACGLLSSCAAGSCKLL